MQMVRHNDIAPDRPSVSIMSSLQLLNHYGSNFFRYQNGSSFESARCDEIDRAVDPDTLEPAKMLTHSPICNGDRSRHRVFVSSSQRAGITDPGYSTKFASICFVR